MNILATVFYITLIALTVLYVLFVVVLMQQTQVLLRRMYDPYYEGIYLLRFVLLAFAVLLVLFAVVG